MHDPLVVAFEIPSLIPRRDRWRERNLKRRWGLIVARRTNPENLGERVYRWWRPAGYTTVLAGRVFKLRTAVTVWHREPDGRDAFSVCKHASRWKWHVHHWHLQIHVVQRFHRWAFERCLECGRRYPWGYAPISHGWNEPRGRWWHVDRRAYHHECSALGHARQTIAQDEKVIRRLFDAYRLGQDVDEVTAANRIFDCQVAPQGEFTDWFNLERRLKWALGWRSERGGHELVPPDHPQHPERASA